MLDIRFISVCLQEMSLAESKRGEYFDCFRYLRSKTTICFGYKYPNVFIKVLI